MSQITELNNNIQTIESREGSEMARTTTRQDLSESQTSNDKICQNQAEKSKNTKSDIKHKSENVGDSKHESGNVVNACTLLDFGLRMNIDNFTFNVLKIEPQSTRFKKGDCNDRLMVQDGPPDGQCFFRSFIVCLRYNMDSTNIGYIITEDDFMNRLIISLKVIIITYFHIHGDKIHQGDFKLEDAINDQHGTVEKWKSKIFKKTYWGGAIEMILLSKIFQLKIKCICRLDTRFNNDYGVEYVNQIIVTLKNNHYKSILFFR